MFATAFNGSLQTGTGSLSANLPPFLVDEGGDPGAMATRGRGVGALEPPAFVLPPRNVRSTLWGRALFSCTVSGSPEPTVTWWHDGVALTSGGRGCAQRSRPGAYSLEIRGLVAADAGRYECEASNDAGSCRLAVQLTVEGEVCLGALLPPLATAYAATPTATAATNRLRRHVLSLGASSPPARLPPHAPRPHLLPPLPAPLSPPPRPFDAKHHRGGVLQTPWQESPPRFAQKPSGALVKEGGTARFSCRPTGRPSPTVAWHRVEEGARVRLATDEGSAALSIAPARREDSGCYSLSVSNAHGSTTVPCNITVLDRPEPPRGCPQVSPRKDGSLALSWSGPADDGGSAVEAYVVEGQRCDAQDGDGAWTELSGSCASTSLTLDSLESGSGWRFRVRARNAHGLGDAGPESQLVTVGNADEAESEPEHHDVVVRTDKKVMDLFERLDKLGTGKFGQVFRLREKSSGREWAGKFSRARRREERENLRREVDIMNSLRHPRIVQCLAAFEAPTEITIVLEYVSGGELFERVSDDDFELTERECVEYMRQILDGVGFIHRQHIVHLDLKPENIMCVNRTGTRIKIIDFGLARRIEPGVPLKVMFGTPEFVAPEVIAFEPVTFVTDMWSIGVICYILVSGISPLAGDTDVETMANVTSCNWDFDDDGFADISEDCKDLIGKMIEKDVKKRWTCEQCVQHPWVQSSPERLEPKQLNKERMRSYITRRKWQKTVHAVRAVGRLAALNAAHMGSTNATATPVSPVSPASPQ
ncbi:unnamed protein product [Lampetra fluviatilis]